MKTISKVLLVFLIPLVAYANPLGNIKKTQTDNVFGKFKKQCDFPPNLVLYTHRDDIVVSCGANISVNAGEGHDIIATCSDGADAVKITNGRVYIDRSTESTENYDVEGTNGDDIIVVCREGVRAGVTVNGLGGNDTIVECPDENTVFVF